MDFALIVVIMIGRLFQKKCIKNTSSSRRRMTLHRSPAVAIPSTPQAHFLPGTHVLSPRTGTIPCIKIGDQF